MLASVRFAAADFVAPALASRKIPAGAGTENMLIVTREKARRFEHGLSGNASGAGVVADSEAELVGVIEAVAKIAGNRAIQKIIVRSLAISLQIGCGGGIVERAEQSAELCAATPRGKIAAFTKETEFGNAGGTTMGEDLDDAGNRICAVNGAFSTADNLDFVDVIECEVREVHSAAGWIDGRAVHEHFGEIGIPTIEENGGGSALRTRAAHRNSRRE